MIGDNGVPETPDWQPEPRPSELDTARRIYRLDLSDEERAAWVRARHETHIERGTN